MKDDQLGLNAYDQGPGFWGISRRVEAELDAVIADDYLWGAPRPLPDHIARFNTGAFLNPDGSYTPSPSQAMELAKLIMEKEAKAARARAAYAPILKELNKMDRDPDPSPPWLHDPFAAQYRPDPAAAQSSGQLAQGPLWMGRPTGGDVPCRCDACREARMPKAYANQYALYSKMAGLARC